MERVTAENVVWVVGELVRRTEEMERHTADLNVIRRDIADGRGEITRMTSRVEQVSGLLVRAAISITTGLILFSATIYSLFK